jgi:hypothetical protein
MLLRWPCWLLEFMTIGTKNSNIATLLLMLLPLLPTILLPTTFEATTPNAVVYNVATTNVTPPAILLMCSTHFISCFYFQYINKNVTKHSL